MKHVFLIHSNTTLRVSLSYIENQGISKNDVIFIYNEIYNAKTNFKVFRYPFCYKPNGDYLHYGLSTLRIIKYCLKSYYIILSNIQLNKFILYLPQSSDRAHSLIASMWLCKNYKYIEEGSLSYFDKKKTCDSKLYSLPKCNNVKNYLKTFGCKLNFLASSYFDVNNKKYNGTIGFSEFSFPDLPKNKAIVPFNINTSNYLIKNITCLIVLDPVVTYNIIDLDLEIEVIQLVLNKIKGKYKEIHYKFHPSQFHNINEVNQIRSIFELNQMDQNFIEIDVNESLEDIICLEAPDIYTSHSSISIYALVLGLKVYSWSDYIISKKQEYNKIIENMPNIYKKNVINLKLEAKL